MSPKAIPAALGVLLCVPLLMPALQRMADARWVLPGGLPGHLLREPLPTVPDSGQTAASCDSTQAVGELAGMTLLPAGTVRRFATRGGRSEALEVELAGLAAPIWRVRVAALGAAGEELHAQAWPVHGGGSGVLVFYVPPARLPARTAALAVAVDPANVDGSLAPAGDAARCGPAAPRVRVTRLAYAGAGAGWLLAVSYLVLPGAFLGAPRRLREVRLVHLFAVLWSSFLVQGLVGWALVAIGWFDPVVDSLVILAASLGALVLRLRRGRPWEPLAGSPVASLGVVAALLVLAWFVRSPSEVVLGASDSGTYRSIATDLASSGQVVVDRPDLTSLTEQERSQLYLPGGMPFSPQSGATYPGYYLMPDGTETNRLFFYPAMLARVVAALGPVHGLLWNGYCALLAVLSFAVLLESLWGIAVALPAALVLSLSIAQIWTSLECFTEPSTQVMLFGGLACWSHWDRTGSRASALLGALALGGMMALRLDAFILYPPLALLLGLRASGRRPRTDDVIATVTFLATVALALRVSWDLSPAYTADVLHSTIFTHAPWLEHTAGWLGLGGFVAAIAALWLLGGANGPGWREKLPLPAAAALGAAALWAASLAPAAYAAHEDRGNLVRLGWYTTGLGLWLGVAGVCGLVAEVRDRRRLTVVACLLATTLLYLQGSRITQVHPYWGRRFVVTAIPLLALGAGWLLARFAASRGLRLPAIVLGLALLAGSLSLVAHLRGRPYYDGLHAQLQAVAERIPSGARLLVLRDGRTQQIVVPLRHAFGVDGYLWTATGDARPLVERWRREGRRTYLLRSADMPFPVASGIATVAEESLVLQFDEIGVSFRAQTTTANPLEHLFVNDEAWALRLGEIVPPASP